MSVHHEFGAVNQRYYYALVWLLLVSFTLFALYVAWDLGLIHRVIEQDRSYLTSAISVLVVLASCHAAWHIIRDARRIHAATEWLQAPPDQRSTRFDDELLDIYLTDIDELNNTDPPTVNSSGDNSTQTLLDIHADRLRAAGDIGWFLVDLAIKLGLLGTIIGFILIFSSLNSTTINGAEGLQDLLVSMSGGMGTALFTTLTGLVGSTILSAQYLLLGRQTEHLLGLLLRLQHHRNSVPTLQKSL